MSQRRFKEGGTGGYDWKFEGSSRASGVLFESFDRPVKF